MKLGEKEGKPVARLITTHAGLISTDDKQMPRGVPSNFLYLPAATNQYAQLKEGKRHFGEAAYTKLFNDFKVNEAQWLEFFHYLVNQDLAGESTLILEELANIYIGRKAWKQCEAVLDFEEKVLSILRKHNLSPKKWSHDYSNQIMRAQEHILTTRYYLNDNLGKYKQNAFVLKEQIKLEKSMTDCISNRVYYTNWQLMVVLYGQTVSNRLPSEEIEELSTDDIAKVLSNANKLKKQFQSKMGFPKAGDVMDEVIKAFDPKMKKQFQSKFGFPKAGDALDEMIKAFDSKMDLLTCDYCGKAETSLGELKRCTICKKVVRFRL